MGAKVVYIKSLNPKELTSVMKEKQITNMIVVPLVAKMLKNSIDKQINKLPADAKKIFNIMYAIAKFMPRFVRRLMFKSIIDGLGGKFECFVSGGAPLEVEIAEFFDRIGVPVFQGYGLTETSPTISTNYYGNNKIGTVGKPLPSVKVKLADNGEILSEYIFQYSMLSDICWKTKSSVLNGRKKVSSLHAIRGMQRTHRSRKMQYIFVTVGITICVFGVFSPGDMH